MISIVFRPLSCFLFVISSAYSQSDCVYNNDYKTQSLRALKGKEELTNRHWDKKKKTAVVLLESGDTLLVSLGGCQHYYTNVSYITHRDIPVDSLDFWYSKTKWIMQTVFDTAYQTKFSTAIDQNKFVRNKEVSKSDHIHVDFPEDNRLTNEYFDGIDIEKRGSRRVLKIEWYMY